MSCTVHKELNIDGPLTPDPRHSKTALAAGSPYIEGLAKLVAVLKADRLTASDQLVRSGTQGTYLYRGMLTKIRAALQAAGVNVASPEGSFDESFVAALKSYQAKIGLPTSGLPDQPTLNALLH